MIRSILGFIGGVIAGQLFILATGILAIQSFGVRLGTIFSATNEIVTIVPGSTPYWFLIPTAVLQAIVAFYCFQFAKPRASSWKLTSVLGFATSLAITSGVALASSSMKAPILGDALAVLPGWQGWLQYGALNPVTYMLSALAFGLVLIAVYSKATAHSGERAQVRVAPESDQERVEKDQTEGSGIGATRRENSTQ